jgi:hypothetical protein
VSGKSSARCDSTDDRALPPDLRFLSAWKYNSYERYTPASAFSDRVTNWLRQFSSPERAILLDFLRRRLVFLSREEIRHLVALAWEDHIRPWLQRQAAAELGLDAFSLPRTAGSACLLSIERRTLVLGLSDGAHLAELRRWMPAFSTHQFYLEPDVVPAARAFARGMAEGVSRNQASGPLLRNIVLVDDFSGTGESLLFLDPGSGSASGRLWRIGEGLRQISSVPGILHPAVEVFVVLYVATQDALGHIRSALQATGLPWRAEAVHVLPGNLAIDRCLPELLPIAERAYGVRPETGRKNNQNRGYLAGTLPLVLHHNTPNDSLALLWRAPKTSEAAHPIALFPRYERLTSER